MANHDRQGLMSVKEPDDSVPEPKWTREPCLYAIEKVLRKSSFLQLSDADKCTVTFYSAGVFNRVYLVRYQKQSQRQSNPDPWITLVMRVSLPLNPGHKTHGEQATLRWLGRIPNLPVPVPKVYDWDETTNNDIGFEWILMEFMPGTTLHQRWRGMTTRQKSKLVKRVAEFQCALLQSHLSHQGIGTLSATKHFHRGVQTLQPGILCRWHFFRPSHVNYDFDRGPFRSTYDWLTAHLKLTIRGYTDRLANAGGLAEEERGRSERSLALALNLLNSLPAFTEKPQPSDPPETTYLWHNDLNSGNILVDDLGNITAILDWETASCEPLFVHTACPRFLLGPDLEVEPLRADYEDSNMPDEDGLDNEGKHPYFWDDLMDYETTQLRKLYRRHMRQMWSFLATPRAPEFERQALRAADFLKAAEQCARLPESHLLDNMERWLEAQVTSSISTPRTE